MSLIRRWRLILGILVVFLIAGLFLLYSSMSYLTRELAEKRVPGLTFSDLEIGWNMLRIQDIRYVDPESERLLLSAKDLLLYPSFASFFSDEIKVSSAEIEEPYVFILRDSEGNLHLPLPESEDAGAEASEVPPAESSSEEPSSFRISINEITGTRGSGDFIDQTVQGPEAHYQFSKLDFLVQGLHHPPQNEPVEFEVTTSIKSSDISQFEVSGWYNFAAPSADLTFHLEDFTLDQGEPYLRDQIDIEAFGDGKIGAEADLTMETGKYLVEGQLILTDLVIAQVEDRILGFPPEILQAFLKNSDRQFTIPFSFEGTLSAGGEPFDPGALLLARLEEELGSNASLLDLLRNQDPEDLRDRLEELKKKGERLRDLFR